MHSLEPTSVLTSQGPCHKWLFNILSRSRSGMLLETVLLLQTGLKQSVFQPHLIAYMISPVSQAQY